MQIFDYSKPKQIPNNPHKIKKIYYTKKRKQQLAYYQIILLAFFISISIIGISQTYTEKAIAKDTNLNQLNFNHQTTSIQPQSQPQPQPETIKQLIDRIIIETKFPYPNYLHKLIKCESNYNPNAININASLSHKSVDLGLLQINNYYNPTITPNQALNPEFSIRFAITEIMKGNQHRWICDKYIK